MSSRTKRRERRYREAERVLRWFDQYVRLPEGCLEWLAFDPLTPAQFQRLEAHLAEKWGVS